MQTINRLIDQEDKLILQVKQGKSFLPSAVHISARSVGPNSLGLQHRKLRRLAYESNKIDHSSIVSATYTLMKGDDTNFSSNTVLSLDKSFSARMLYDQWVSGIVWEESLSG